jgi:hypothetical protein
VSEISSPIAAPMSPKSVWPVAPYIRASPYSSVAEPTEPITRYLSPASSEVARRSSVAHSTYSGIDSSSSPTNSAIRFSASARTTMPLIEPSSSP